MDNSVRILIFVESRYKVSRKKITASVKNLLKEKEMVGSAVEISIAIVGDRKMKVLNKKYRGKEGTTNVLTFSQSEGEGVPQVASKTLHLGDVVISYPQVIREAARDDMLVDEKIDQLVVHGVMHLLGLHHE